MKVIKPGMDSKQVIARFEAERQALAMMDHPNIARVLDGGSDRFGAALLRDGSGARHADHRVLRPATYSHPRAAGVVRPRSARPCNTPTRKGSSIATSSRQQRAGHAARRTCRCPRSSTSASPRPLDQQLTEESLVHRIRSVGRHTTLHEPGTGGDERSGHRHAHATSTRWACCCTSC